MLHARADYDRIQDPLGKISEAEPVFLVRAQDEAAPYAVRAWAEQAERLGADPDLVAKARRHADLMVEWQLDIGSKIPDAPTSVL